MPPTRSGPKTWKGTKKGWPSKGRTYPWRKGTKRPVTMALTGMKAGVPRSPVTHRFSRWTNTYSLRNFDVGGGIAGFQFVSEGPEPIPIFIGAVSPGGSAGIAGVYSLAAAAQFSLIDLPNYTEFTSLFDKYSIEQVDFVIENAHNAGFAAVTAGGATSLMPRITYCPDFDDAIPPSTAREINNYQRAKVWTFRGDGSPLKFSIKPRVATKIYRDAVADAFGTGAEGTKLDNLTPDVPHYGLKMWLENLISSSLPDPVVAGQTLLTFKMRYHMVFNDPV